MTTEVWFIRHGESEANAGLATLNAHEIPLTEAGHEQARKVSKAFERAPDLIVTSTYRRAIQTAEHTMARFPNVPVESWDMHEFTYLSLAGPTTFHDRRPLAHAYWERYDPDFIDGDGAESFAQFMGRVKNMHENIQQRRGQFQFIAIFGHGFLMKAMLWAHLVGSFDVTKEYMQRMHEHNNSYNIANGTIIKAEYKPDTVLLSGMLTHHLGT